MRHSLESAVAGIVKCYKFLFPDYPCPAYGGKLYKIYPVIDSDTFFVRILFGKTLFWTIAYVLFIELFVKLFGFILAITILLISYLYFLRMYPDIRDKTTYQCESCDKEFGYSELLGSKGE